MSLELIKNDKSQNNYKTSRAPANNLHNFVDDSGEIEEIEM
jgi:hypothetical protein